MRHVHPPNAKVQALAAKLIGTTGEGLTDDLADLTTDECASLDVIAFECVGCNWWFAAHERVVVNDEWYCDGCAEESRRPS